MKISVVIPNYNGLNLLKKNLPKLLDVIRNEKVESEIILVDDASQDESVLWLKNFQDEYKNQGVYIKIMTNDINKGFSYTANRGAFSATGEFIIFLNTDVYPKKDFIKKALRHFDDTKVFAVGFMDESIERDKTILRGRGIGWWEKGFYLHKKGEVNENQTDWVSGGSGIFKTNIFKKLKGFNTIYDPFYWEDIDLSYRAKKAGYILLFEPESIVVHEHEKGAILSKYKKKDIIRISYRNQFIFVWKNATLVQFLSHIVWLPYHLISSLRSDKELLLGFLSALYRMTKFTFRTQ